MKDFNVFYYLSASRLKQPLKMLNFTLVSCFFLPTFADNFRNRLLKYEFKPHAVHFFSVLGLLLRTVCNNWSHTVYSLVLSESFVYCGTKTGTIPAFEFTVSFELIQINEK